MNPSRAANFLTFLLTPGVCGQLHGNDNYIGPQVYESPPRVEKEMSLDCIGATAIKAHVYPGVILKIVGVTE